MCAIFRRGFGGGVEGNGGAIGISDRDHVGCVRVERRHAAAHGKRQRDGFISFDQRVGGRVERDRLIRGAVTASRRERERLREIGLVVVFILGRPTRAGDAEHRRVLQRQPGCDVEPRFDQQVRGVFTHRAGRGYEVHGRGVVVGNGDGPQCRAAERESGSRRRNREHSGFGPFDQCVIQNRECHAPGCCPVGDGNRRGRKRAVAGRDPGSAGRDRDCLNSGHVSACRGRDRDHRARGLRSRRNINGQIHLFRGVRHANR